MEAFVRCCRSRSTISALSFFFCSGVRYFSSADSADPELAFSTSSAPLLAPSAAGLAADPAAANDAGAVIDARFRAHAVLGLAL